MGSLKKATKKTIKKKPASPKPTTFNSLEEVVAAIEAKRDLAINRDGEYAQAVIDLTGHDPRKPLSPMDIVKIMMNVGDKRYVQHD